VPSNLRSTTCEYVHLVAAGHFQSRDKDGSHTIQSTIAGNPMLHANLMALCVLQKWSYGWSKFHFQEYAFLPFLLLWPCPWPDDLHIWTWPVFPGDTLDVQIWTSFVKAF